MSGADQLAIEQIPPAERGTQQIHSVASKNLHRRSSGDVEQGRNQIRLLLFFRRRSRMAHVARRPE